MSYHAKLGPSSASWWTSCTAGPNAIKGLPNTAGEAARVGTTGHQISAECKEHGFDPQDYLNRVMNFYADNSEDWADKKSNTTAVLHTVTVTQALVDAVSTAVKYVMDLYELIGGEMWVEQRVPIGQFTGEYDDDGEPAGGTADTIIKSSTTYFLFDDKYGRLPVTAFDWIEYPGEDIITGQVTDGKKRPNLQLACYALGALEKFGSDGITHVTMTIIQPFLDTIEEYTCTVEELREVEEFLREKAEETRTKPKFAPSFKACHFCAAKGRCPAQTKAATDIALEGFEDIDDARVRPIFVNTLGSLYEKVPFVRDWCEAVDTLVLSELKDGRPVINNSGVEYKLVAGKMGNRQWTDAAEAEKRLKGLRLKNDQMYTRKLISPTGVEELATEKRNRKKEVVKPAVLSPLQWERLQALITQKDGKDSPVVVLATDPRPALSQAAEGFDDVTTPETDTDLGEFF